LEAEEKAEMKVCELVSDSDSGRRFVRLRGGANL
jgi:hypothetical protein